MSKQSEQRLDSLSPLPLFAPVKSVSSVRAAAALATIPESTLRTALTPALRAATVSPKGGRRTFLNPRCSGG